MRFGLHLNIMSILFVFSLLLLLEVPKLCTAEKKEEKWNYFMLVQQWPTGFCEYQIIAGKRKCYITPDKFVIHGLWPQRNDGKVPKCQSKTPLYRRDLKPLDQALRSDWPNLVGQDFNFWKSQWGKHGGCAEATLPKAEYFNLALHIYDQNKILNILEKEQIVPDDKKLYNVSSVVAAVHNHTSHDPELSCYHDPKLNVTVLYQIRICLTKNGTSLTNCLNPDSSCGDQSLLFPKKEEEK
ncbi:ribonuclease 1-like [Vigna unguiculata]|uniref:ribonuclease 1-like n=1 Tax=Vigna unguiculata TaxID=3917 RepID=UPI001016FC47|nr:ribonuclease 1-like [Vigna unguiculata]